MVSFSSALNVLTFFLLIVLTRYIGRQRLGLLPILCPFPPRGLVAVLEDISVLTGPILIGKDADP